MTWTEGICPNCEIAKFLTSIQFTSTNDGWGVGCTLDEPGNFIGHQEYCTIAHTVDGGSTWVELPSVTQYPGRPALWFNNPNQGWISWWRDAAAKYAKLIHTTDGGRHWKATTEQGFRELQFFDDHLGYGTGWGGSGGFFLTVDGGRTWNETKPSGITSVRKLFFFDSQTGWLAGPADSGIGVLRTIDGGRHWEVANIRTKNPTDIRALYFLDPVRGWLILNPNGVEGSRLYRTIDGGRTWSTDPDASFQGAGAWMSSVRFAHENLGFAFYDTRAGTQQLQQYLLYTSDQGAHWQRIMLPAKVYECRVFNGGVVCSAAKQQNGLLLLSVRPRSRP